MSPLPVALEDNLVIHPIGQASKIGSIDIPEAYKKKINNGIVVSKGPRCRYADISIGDHVGFGVRVGTQITLENGQFYIIAEDDIACKYVPSNVRLIDTETVKRIIQERMTELLAIQDVAMRAVGDDWFIPIQEIEKSLLDRIDTITMAEAFEL